MYRAMRRSTVSNSCTLVELAATVPFQSISLTDTCEAVRPDDCSGASGPTHSRVVKRSVSQVDVSDVRLSANASVQERVSLKSERTAHFEFTAFPCSCHAILLEDNPSIITGHRLDVANNFFGCTKSIFTLHNDTLNIWTHLLGALGWPCVFWSFLRQQQSSSSSHDQLLIDYVCIGLFTAFVSIGLLSSAIYHVYRVYSVRAYINTLICDLVGVLLQLSCCIGLIVYYGIVLLPVYYGVVLLSRLFALSRLVLLSRLVWFLSLNFHVLFGCHFLLNFPVCWSHRRVSCLVFCYYAPLLWLQRPATTPNPADALRGGPRSSRVLSSLPSV
eukprot:TRINITY_DN194_c0_g1_i3.p1 TRINITY_DN194_c0_g1~~TRINITY_DN194_c0_g1_i3.p1  ORF type:complete len:330 (-),score=-5.69 TRINITY_DN194_c0_g1_i3:201-1190(-)